MNPLREAIECTMRVMERDGAKFENREAVICEAFNASKNAAIDAMSEVLKRLRK